MFVIGVIFAVPFENIPNSNGLFMYMCLILKLHAWNQTESIEIIRLLTQYTSTSPEIISWDPISFVHINAVCRQ